MRRNIGWCWVLLASSLFTDIAPASTLNVKFDLPRFASSNYNRPYVAIWVESKQAKKTLLLWHSKRSNNDKWLVDVRRWWRKLGRYGEPDLDAVTGATRGPGKYLLPLDVGELREFNLMIEVAREDGGRSMLRQPINLDQKDQYLLAADTEIGEVSIHLEK